MAEVFSILNKYADAITALAEVLAFIVGAIAIIISVISNSKAKEANRLSNVANQISKESNSLANTANIIANDSLKYTQALNLSRFIIEIHSVGIENHGIYADELDTFLSEGRILISFKVHNISQNRALFAEFKSDDKKEKLRTTGEIIDPDEENELKYSFAASKFKNKKPEESLSNGKIYKDTIYLHWDNGVLSCSCKVEYELIIEKHKNNNGQMCYRARPNTYKCDIGEYTFKSF